jgi:DNA-binding NtrC family response regulator
MASSLLSDDTDGLLLLAANQATDAEQIRCVVQEISLRELPPMLVLIEAGDGQASASFDGLENYVAARVRWPDEAGVLQKFVRKSGHRSAFRALGEELLESAISRRLTSLTPSMESAVDSIALAASYDVPVLITGETGTGKNYLARLIHEFSARRNHRFLVVSCGCLASNLIESELFGHAKGAFTGADRTKEGKFAAAGQGTLLLDEIDTLGLDLQASLLRVLETGEYEPVGSNETEVREARIIVASNVDLEAAVAEGKFRRDLYYRLNVVALHVPPLRRRFQDIGPLARGLTALYNAKFRKDLFHISEEALGALETFSWPGNIRQLENVLQRAVLASSGPELLLSHLPPTLKETAPQTVANGRASGDTLALNRDEAERLLIQQALINAHHHRADAALALGISRVTLYKKMKKYGLANGKRRSRKTGTQNGHYTFGSEQQAGTDRATTSA